MEVFPKELMSLQLLASLLHVRGGVSLTGKVTIADLMSSPRPWRCFDLIGRLDVSGRVFSTSVEVFLQTDVFCVT